MNLNERAAKAMGWFKCPSKNSYSWVVSGTKEYTGFDHSYCRTNEHPSPIFDPQHDYNHARMLYERVVEKGLKDVLILEIEERLAGSNIELGASDGCLLDVEADLLTLACCEVLENNDE